MQSWCVLQNILHLMLICASIEGHYHSEWCTHIVNHTCPSCKPTMESDMLGASYVIFVRRGGMAEYFCLPTFCGHFSCLLQRATIHTGFNMFNAVLTVFCWAALFMHVLTKLCTPHDCHRNVVPTKLITLLLGIHQRTELVSCTRQLGTID